MPLFELQPSQEGRTRVFVRAQLPLFGATVFVAIMTAIGHPQSLTDPNFLIGTGVITVASIAGLLFPWERFPGERLAILAAVDLIGIAFLRSELLPIIPSVGFLTVFPILWLSYGFRRRFLTVAIVGAFFITALPNVLSGDYPNSTLEWVNVIVLPTIVSGVAIAVNTAAQQLIRARRLVAESNRDLTSSLARAHDSENLSRAILDTVDAAVAFYDADSTLIVANPNAHAMVGSLGFRLDQPPYGGLEVLQADRSTRIPIEDQIIPRALRGEMISNHMEWLGPVGSQTAILATSRQVWRENGDLHGTVIVAYDITPLADAISVREQFLTTVSHELRTPLTSIIGYLELIEDSLDEEPLDIAAYLTVAQRNSAELLSRISQLLQFSADGIPIERALTDLSSLATSVVADFSMAADAAGVSLSSSLPSGIHAWVDAGRYRQVVENLISNSIKYTQRDGAIDITLTSDPVDAVLTVADNGRGMTTDETRQAFERFFRAPNARGDAIQGFGVGLSIVKEIVEAHSGTVGIVSEPGHGTSIAVSVPLSVAVPVLS